jgi:phage FluMu protein Com
MGATQVPKLIFEYAESLGLAAICTPCNIAMAEWDTTKHHWVDADGTAIISNRCPQCQTVHVLRPNDGTDNE